MARHRVSRIPIKDTSKTTTRSRRTPVKKITFDIEEPEYYLWSQWKDIYLCGTEWTNIPQVHSNPWDFSALKEHLDDVSSFEEFGIKNFSQIFLFGGTEAQSLPNGKVVLVPYILAAVGDVSPPKNVGVTSIQRARENIVPMSNFNLSWVPYSLDLVSRRKKDQQQPQIWYMNCKTRQQVVKHMTEDEAVEYNYIIPHLLAPKVVLADSEPPTNINERIEFHGKGLQLTFDWEVDTLKSYVEGICEEYDFNFAEVGKELRDIILEEKKKVLDAFAAEEEAKKKTFYDLPESEQKALKEEKFIKFYPSNSEIEPFKNPMINRYYGKADVIV